MSMTTTELLKFFSNHQDFIIDRYEINLDIFRKLRHDIYSLLKVISEDTEQDTEDIIIRLRSVISEWLTAPVKFDERVQDTLHEIGKPFSVGNRWGKDSQTHFEAALKTAKEITNSENPMRSKLKDLIIELHKSERKFYIFCHKRAREHFQSLFDSSDEYCLLDEYFIQSAADYRKTGLFDVLIKVGPFRSAGWGAVPDALFSAPHFDTIVQLIWSDCRDEVDFGYDPVTILSRSTTQSFLPGSASSINLNFPELSINWKKEIKFQQTDTIGIDDPDIFDEFMLFDKITKSSESSRAVLVQIDDNFGILYPPSFKVLGMHSDSNNIEYGLPNEILQEGMYLILPVINDENSEGIKGEDGSYAQVWKDKLQEQKQKDIDYLANRLWDAHLYLVGLHSCIDQWCKPATTVIHAPRKEEHFKILIEVLGLNSDNNESKRETRIPWWQYAWNEIRRSRGEAIHTGFQAHQNDYEKYIAIIPSLDSEIRSNAGKDTFELKISKSFDFYGVFRFYRVKDIEEGFRVPSGELKSICELDRIYQWRQ